MMIVVRTIIVVVITPVIAEREVWIPSRPPRIITVVRPRLVECRINRGATRHIDGRGRRCFHNRGSGRSLRRYKLRGAGGCRDGRHFRLLRGLRRHNRTRLIEHGCQDAIRHALGAQVKDLGRTQAEATVAILDVRHRHVVTHLRPGELQNILSSAGQLDRLRRARKSAESSGGSRFLRASIRDETHPAAEGRGGDRRGGKMSDTHSICLSRRLHSPRSPAGRQVTPDARVRKEMAVTANEIPTQLRHRTADNPCPQPGETIRWGAGLAGIGRFGGCAREPVKPPKTGASTRRQVLLGMDCGGPRRYGANHAHELEIEQARGGPRLVNRMHDERAFSGETTRPPCWRTRECGSEENRLADVCIHRSSPPRLFSAPIHICLVVAWLLACPGCVSRPKPLPAGQQVALQRRSDTQFAAAILLKPTESLATNDLGVALSPLLVQETGAHEERSLTNATPLILLHAEASVQIAGKPHRQICYVWQQPGDEANGKSGDQFWQGVRITLNSAGQPTIWEVLRDGSGAHIIFVTQSVEVAAQKEFGPPPPGRRFSVERAVEESPTVVVARVIDDGPVPMGPIVHVNARGDITTVNCRCMPTQAQRLVAQGGYGLVADPSALEAWPPSQRPADSAHLAQVLRLPSNF